MKLPWKIQTQDFPRRCLAGLETILKTYTISHELTLAKIYCLKFSVIVKLPLMGRQGFRNMTAPYTYAPFIIHRAEFSAKIQILMGLYHK